MAGRTARSARCRQGRAAELMGITGELAVLRKAARTNSRQGRIARRHPTGPLPRREGAARVVRGELLLGPCHGHLSPKTVAQKQGAASATTCGVKPGLRVRWCAWVRSAGRRRPVTGPLPAHDLRRMRLSDIGWTLYRGGFIDWWRLTSRRTETHKHHAHDDHCKPAMRRADTSLPRYFQEDHSGVAQRNHRVGQAPESSFEGNQVEERTRRIAEEAQKDGGHRHNRR